MKNNVLLFVTFLSINSFAQKDSLTFPYTNLDTIESYSGILLSAGPNGYAVNEKKVDKKTYDGYKRAIDKTDDCKPCWLKEYNIDGNLVSEGVYYGGECRIGVFIQYSETGTRKFAGHYKENNTGDWTDFYKKGFCSVRDGIWIFYNGAGKISKKETYKNGELIE